MRSRVLLTGLVWVVLAAAALTGWTWGWREHSRAADDDFLRRRLALIESENQRQANLIADRQRADVAVDDRTRRGNIERTVARLRGLDFLQPVTYKEIPRAELPAILRQKLAQQVPDQEFGDTGVSLAALGLLPARLDLKRTYLDLLGEQIGAFYDQHSAELFTFSGQGLDNGQNRVILAHELTHALEDQHFHLARLPLEAKGNDDRALAASALVEGDATLVMSQFMLGDLSASSAEDTLLSSLSTDVRQLAAAPRFLRESLLFPYLRGQEFCQTLYQTGGWKALAAAFQHPPENTAEILHPERFLAPDAAARVEIQLPGGAVLGQLPIGNNVLGEFGVRQLLVRWLKDDVRAERVAAGWTADRYLVYGDARASSFVWKSRWSTPQAAADFAGAAEQCWRERFHLPVDTFQKGARTNIRSASLPNGHQFLIVHTGEQVTVVDAQDHRWETALTELLGTDPVSGSLHDGHAP